MKCNVRLEFAGAQYTMEEIRKAVKNKVTEMSPKEASKIKEIGIYMQPETNYIYYTIDGKGSIDQYISFDDVMAAKTV